MRRWLIWLSAVSLLLPALPAQAAPAQAQPSGSLSAFRNDGDLLAYLRKVRIAEEAFLQKYPPPPPPPPAPPPPPPPPPPPGAAPTAGPPPAFGGGITNTQEATVDEGDIVKARGDILVILRRGRLFTVSTAGGGLKAVSRIDASPPGIDARGDWYDEMLVAGDRVVVVGYSYARGGTQIVRFHLGDDGSLTFEDAYQLRSADYYSSENYATRLIGSKLIVYSPLPVFWGANPLEALPALRRWESQKDRKAGFRRIASASSIYVPPILRDDPNAGVSVLHSVTRCDLTATVLDCASIGVLGPWSRSFYVSGKAVYVFTGDAWRRGWDAKPTGRAGSFLYRLPLNGGKPSAIRVRGMPVDQFSFREDAADGVLNVLVRSQGEGDAMWRKSFASGSVALLRLPISDFGAGSREAAARRYRDLPLPTGNGYDFQNRYAGAYLMYGKGVGWGDPSKLPPASLTVVPVAGGPIVNLEPGHSVDRLDVLGGDGIVIGARGPDTVFTTIDLSGPAPKLGAQYVRENAGQTESRSHAFFFRPDTADGRTGLLGLPIAKPGNPLYWQLFQSSAAMVFVRRQDGVLSGVGDLSASLNGAVDDNCVASCTDWYGNARPIFYQGRVFALMGYEMVEGRLEGGMMREVGRVSFAPGK